METVDRLSRKVIEFAFYLLFFLTPLTLFPTTFELFEFNKMMLIYALTVVISAAWVVQMLIHKRLIIRRTPFDLPLLLFLASQVLSTIFSIHVRTSLIGYYSRFHGGLYSTASYLVLYWAFCTFMCKTQNAKRKAQNNLPYALSSTPLATSIALLLTSGAVVSLYAMAEHFGIDKTIWKQDVQRRVFSTLGQPNWLAAFLLMLLPLPIAMRLRKDKGFTLSVVEGLFAVYFLALLYTKSRSGLVAFGVLYASFWGLLYIVRHKLGQFPTRALILFSTVVLLTASFDGLRWVKPVEKLYGLAYSTLHIANGATSYEPLATSQVGTQLESGGTESGEIRKIVWRGALNVWRHWPVFGSGVETFAFSYYNFQPKEHNLVSEWNFLYNKAHNEYLNFLATTGIVGLATYLLLQLWFVAWGLRKIVDPHVPRATSYVLIALLSGYLALSISNFFGFSTVTVGMLSFLWLGFAVTFAVGEATNHESKIINHKSLDRVSPSQRLSLLGLLLATSYVLFALGRWWYADTRFALGKKLHDAGQAAQAFPYLRQAAHLLPQEPNFRAKYAEDLADMAIALAKQEDADVETVTQFAALAISEIQTARVQNPVDIKFIKSEVRVLNTLSALDPELIKDIESVILEAIRVSPTDPSLYYNLGVTYAKTDRPEEAEKMLLMSIDLKPDYEPTRLALGDLYEKQNEFQKAREQYKYLLERNPTNETAKERLEKL